MQSRCLVIFMLFALLALNFGCSQGSSTVLPDPLSKGRDSQTTTHSILGAWTITLDGVNMEVDVVPLRTSEFHLNLLPFIEWKGISSLMIANFTIDSIKNTAGLDIGIPHPFPGLLRFSTFDTKGIIITDGSLSGYSSDPEIILSGPDELRITNADGMTRWWNPREFPLYDSMFGYSDGIYGRPDSMINFSSTLNPFKYYTEEFGVGSVFPDDLDFDRRGLFIANSATKWRRFEFDFGGEALFGKFNYLWDACWEWYEDYNQGYFPTIDDIPDPFFPITANSPEPFALKINEDQNTLWYVSEMENGGNLNLAIDVYDWAGMRLEGGIPDEVSEVIVESLTLPGPVIVNGVLDTSGTDPHYSTWKADLVDCHPDGVSDQEILITVVSTEGSYKFIAGIDTGFTGSTDTIAAYLLYAASVSPDLPDFIEVTSPSGGEILIAGEVNEITWDSGTGIPTVKIEYSFDGLQYYVIDGNVSNLPGANSYILWDTNGIGDATVTIKITDIADGIPFGESDQFILEKLTLDEPDAVDDPGFLVGVSRAIHWHTESGNTDVIQNVIVEFSKTSGSGPWVELYNGANSGNFMWTPELEDVTTEGRIRVTDPAHSVLTDKSGWDFDVLESAQVDLLEYQDFFDGTTYFYRGRITDCSGLDSYLDGTNTTWDFVTDSTLTDRLGPNNFFVQTTNGSMIGHTGTDAPEFGVNDHAMRANELPWPPDGPYLYNSIKPEWVYNFDIASDILSFRGADNYFEAWYFMGEFLDLPEGYTTHQYDLSGNHGIQFPLDKDSGQTLIDDTGEMWGPHDPNPYNSQYDGEWTVVAIGKVRVPMGVYPRSLLVKHRMGSVSSSDGDVAITGLCMFQWLDTDTGMIIAYIQTHNSLTTTRFDAGTGMITGEALIGALVFD